MDIAKHGRVSDDILQQIKHLRLIDDVLMVKCFENNPRCAELILGLIFKKSEYFGMIPQIKVERQGWTSIWQKKRRLWLA